MGIEPYSTGLMNLLPPPSMQGTPSPVSFSLWLFCLVQLTVAYFLFVLSTISIYSFPPSSPPEGNRLHKVPIKTREGTHARLWSPIPSQARSGRLHHTVPRRTPLSPTRGLGGPPRGNALTG